MRVISVFSLLDHFLRSWCFRKYAPLIATLLFVACTETVDESARYVFLHDTAASYLSKHDVYSEYVGLIKKMPISTRSSSTVFQLLSARGHYTVFAPTNNAINQYLVQLATTGIIPTPSWDAFTDSTLLDSIRRVIVMNSIIDGGDVDVYHTYEFPTQTNGEFPRSNMKDVKLTVRYTGNPDEIFICRDCPINVRNRDITATNGVLHQMDRVIAPEDKTMASMLREYLAGRREGFCVMARLCEACGLLDTLSRVRDDRYEQLYQRGLIAPTCPANGMASVYPGQSYTPQHRKYGFTIFAEPDIFWENQLGKDANDITPADIQEWVAQQGYYPEYHSTSDYTSNDNLLYQWTTYHILDYKLAPNRLTYHFCEYGYNYQFSTGRYTIPVMEYYTTFGPRRLLKIYESPEAGGIYLNRFPIIDNQRTGTGHEVGCSPDNAGNRIDNDDPTLALHSASNGYLYSIDTPLAYSPTVRNNLGRERIRIDAASFFPEATNSDIRCQMVDDNEHGWVHIPYDADRRFTSNYRGVVDPMLGVPLDEQEINHAALVEGMDKSLGDILDYLQLHPDVARNTILLFMSDNGGQSVDFRQGRKNLDQNFPARAGKGSALEGGIHEPMMVLWPGVTRGGSVNANRVIIEDFFPTLLSMAGIRDYRTVQHVDGVDFTPLLLHPRRRHQRTLLFHFPNVWVQGYQEADGFGAYSALLQGDHHLIYFWASRQFRLYNRRRDIAETHDLSETHPRLLRRLAQQLTDSLLAMQAQRPSDLTGSPVPWPIEALTNKNRKK